MKTTKDHEVGGLSMRSFIEKALQQSGIVYSTLEEEIARLEELYSLGIIDSPQDQKYDRITRIVSQAFKVPICFISFITEDRQWFKSCVGMDPIVGSSREIDRSASFCQHVVATNQPVIVTDVKSHPLLKGKHSFEKSNTKFYVGVPLKTKRGNIIGSLCILDTKPRSFSDEELTLLTEYTDWVMAEVELEKELRLQKENNEFMKAMSEISLSIEKSFRVKLRMQLKECLARFDLEYGCLLKIANEEELEVEFEVSKDGTSPLPKRFYIGKEDLIPYTANPDIVIIQNASKSKWKDHPFFNRAGIENFIIVPILIEQEVYGLVALFDLFNRNQAPIKKSWLPPDNKGMLLLMGQWVSAEMQREKAQKEVEKLAFYDAMTNLPNRASFIKKGKTLIRNENSFSLLFMDLDGFKRVNDDYGHYIGDLLLKETGNRLTMFQTKKLHFYRYAGDEFVAIFEGVLSRSQMHGLTHKIIYALGEPFELEQYKINISVSIGVSNSVPHSRLDQLMIQADRAMYESKKAFGARATFYDEINND